MNKQARKKRKATAMRELAATVEHKIQDMPPLKKLEDGPTQRGIAAQLRKQADNLERE